ncbi:MAG: phosphohistidine phosphatase SixA [Chthoniobacterales bacterium]
MNLYFLRHGRADWPDWDKPDDERPLTKRGKKQVGRVAKMLCKLKVRPDIILTSPLPRAEQTAQIAAKHLCADVRVEPSLAKGFNVEKLGEILKSNAVAELMLVGHEPDFSAVIHAVTGGDVKLAKAGVARVDLERGAKTGRLLWLLPPKLAKL